jgi:hypothetical protein
VREDLGEEFVREGAEGGSLSLGGVEWSGNAHAGFVDLRREGWAEKEKMSWQEAFMQDAAMG